jgi:hypothetical protein
MAELMLDRVMGSLGGLPSSGDAPAMRPRYKLERRDPRLVAALLIWAMSISFCVSLAHHGVHSNTQADSWVCKRH